MSSRGAQMMWASKREEWAWPHRKEASSSLFSVRGIIAYFPRFSESTYLARTGITFPIGGLSRDPASVFVVLCVVIKYWLGEPQSMAALRWQTQQTHHTPEDVCDADGDGETPKTVVAYCGCRSRWIWCPLTWVPKPKG